MTRKPKRGAYGAYLTLCEEQGVASVSQRAFYAETQRWKTKYELTLAREGARAAYPFKNYHHPGEKTINRHGDYAWAKSHLDHLEVDMMLLDSKTRKLLGKCWLTLLNSCASTAYCRFLSFIRSAELSVVHDGVADVRQAA